MTNTTLRPRLQTINVTRRQAREWLENSISNNRPLSQPTVEQYQRDMDAEDWHINGETVKINSDGQLFDGRHRMQALLASKRKSVTMIALQDNRKAVPIHFGLERLACK